MKARIRFFLVILFLSCYYSCRADESSVVDSSSSSYPSSPGVVHVADENLQDGVKTKEQQQSPSPPPQTCSITEQSQYDPNLHEMTYDVGDGDQTVLVYIEPNVTTYYRQGFRDLPTTADGRRIIEKVPFKFDGLSGKFINMSHKRCTFAWEASKDGPIYEMNHMPPFGATGTGTFVGHRFVFTKENRLDKIWKRWKVKSYPENIHYFDPYVVENDPIETEKVLQEKLTPEERVKYDAWRKTIRFNEQYKAVTGRSYLANYLRKAPIHYMWPADYFGQVHWITTRETHFATLPPQEQLQPISPPIGSHRQLKHNDPRLLQEYRTPNMEVMNMTLKVLSCAPRVYEIPDFLSAVEVQHVLDLASNIDLKLSSTGESDEGLETVDEDDNRRTRTSYNSWIKREKSPIMDAIYRRAADLLRIDEAMLRFRSPDELSDAGLTTRASLAEDFQLVHYSVGQEYNAHHDFGYTRIENKEQGDRFATLLLYLNEVPKGGETSFPRWSNVETSEPLDVKPDKVGKAVLFYSQLPDGNFDDLSQHAALPVIEGEKWLINLWVHSPVRE